LGTEHNTAINQLERLIMEQAQSWESLDGFLQRNLHLQARQGSADAKVDAMPERLMPVRVALDIKSLRVGKLARVEVV